MRSLLIASFCLALAGCSVLPYNVQTWVKDKGAVACVSIPGLIQSNTDVKALFVSKGDTKAADNVQKAIDALKQALAACKSQGL